MRGRRARSLRDVLDFSPAERPVAVPRPDQHRAGRHRSLGPVRRGDLLVLVTDRMCLEREGRRGWDRVLRSWHHAGTYGTTREDGSEVPHGTVCVVLKAVPGGVLFPRVGYVLSAVIPAGSVQFLVDGNTLSSRFERHVLSSASERPLGGRIASLPSRAWPPILDRVIDFEAKVLSSWSRRQLSHVRRCHPDVDLPVTVGAVADARPRSLSSSDHVQGFEDGPCAAADGAGSRRLLESAVGTHDGRTTR